MDDILGNDVSWGGLGTKNAHQRHSRGVTRANLEILMDEVEQVQLLALVLMQALGLNIKDSLRVYRDILGAQQPVCQLLLVGGLNSGQLIQHDLVACKRQQLFQLGGILAEAGADVLFQRGGQARVAFQQPAAEGDTVGLVVKLLRVQLVEAVQLGVLQNFSVQSRHAVGGVGKVDVHVRHVYPIILVDNGKALVLGAGAGQLVQLFNDRHQLRHNGIQIGARPLLQRLCQNRVVGVSAGLGDDLNGLLKLDSGMTMLGWVSLI